MGSTGGAGFTVVSVGAVSETPNDRLRTRSMRLKNLDGTNISVEHRYFI